MVHDEGLILPLHFGQMRTYVFVDTVKGDNPDIQMTVEFSRQLLDRGIVTLLLESLGNNTSL